MTNFGIVSKRGMQFIIHFEGFRSKPYKCPGGVRTIGYGHVIKKNDPLVKGKKEIEEWWAYYMLGMDLRPIEAFISNADMEQDMHLEQHQFDALASFIYNLGVNRVRQSTFWKVLLETRGVYSKELAYQWSRWDKVKGKPLRGLTNRREAEIKLFLLGDYGDAVPNKEIGISSAGNE